MTSFARESRQAKRGRDRYSLLPMLFTDFWFVVLVLAIVAKNGAWGAVELKGRVHALELDEATFPTFADPARSVTDARAWAVGVNWHLNQNVKLVVDYERTDFDRGAPAGADRHVEQGILTRLQLAF